MAPAATVVDDEIRVFLGAWDAGGVSRITSVRFRSDRPDEVIERRPMVELDIGASDAFDGQGVFPGSVWLHGNRSFLHYTGFSRGVGFRHLNFGGLAEIDTDSLTRVSPDPVMGPTPEGMCVRAGVSTVEIDGRFLSVYAAGNDWMQVGGKLRPCYSIFSQWTDDGLAFREAGNKIVAYDSDREHAVGRPHILVVGGMVVTVFTVRTLDMRYTIGAAVSSDGSNWERLPVEFEGAPTPGFDDLMTYFPSPVVMSDGTIFVYYSGNGFGETGMGMGVLDFV